jgi:hypothetical protein
LATGFVAVAAFTLLAGAVFGFTILAVAIGAVTVGASAVLECF